MASRGRTQKSWLAQTLVAAKQTKTDKTVLVTSDGGLTDRNKRCDDAAQLAHRKDFNLSTERDKRRKRKGSSARCEQESAQAYNEAKQGKGRFF